MKVKFSVFFVTCCLGGCVVSLVGGCENFGDLTGGSKSAADAIVVTNSEEAVSSGPPKEVWVDDNFNSHTSGWGYDHFSHPGEGIAAVAAGGTVYICEGWYPEDVNANGKDCHMVIVGSVSFSATPPPGYGTKQLNDVNVPSL